MRNQGKIAAVVLTLAGAMPALAALPPTALVQLHRGDFVRVSLLDGPIYHLQLSGIDDASLVGRSGIVSLHLPRREIANVEREAAPHAALNEFNPMTLLSLLGLSAASVGAAHSFGDGQTCSGKTLAC